MRVAYITAGAAGMFCGSCMRDNALVSALRELGHDALLVPTYTPIRTDDTDVSGGRVFLGGLSVYLREYLLFRAMPRWALRWLDHPAVIRLATKRAKGEFDYASLATLTESMLAGADGRQRHELAELVAWLKAEVRPEAVVLTNALLSGIVPTVAKELGVPVLTTLQGDDIFLDALPAAARNRCIEAVRRNDAHTAGYIATSRFYADHMATYLGIDRGKVDVVWPGIKLTGHDGPAPPVDRPPTVGYFARICPEKGFHNAVAAFARLKKLPGMAGAKFRAGGWLGPQHRAFFAEQVRTLEAAGVAGDFEHVDCPDHASKVRFFHSIDVLTVPTDYREPKGLYVLEAWANGVPVVQPAHGSFPELVEVTAGGLLVPPGDPDALAHGLHQLLADPARRRAMGGRANAVVRERFSAKAMAEATAVVLNKHVRPAA